MPKSRSNGSNRRAPTDKRTDTHTHRRYQTYYLPSYAVDNNIANDGATDLHMAVKTNSPVLCWNSSNNHDTAVSEPTGQKITSPYVANLKKMLKQIN